MSYLLVAIAFCAGGAVGSLRCWDAITDAKRYRAALITISRGSGFTTPGSRSGQHTCGGAPGCPMCTAHYALHPQPE